MPQGLGVFVRGAFTPNLRWRFVLINAWAGNAAGQAERAHNAGAEVWLYGLPGKFAPNTWRAGLAYIRTRARSIPHVVGIIPDLENGWTGANDPAAREFGAALRETAASGLRVGVTGYPFVSWLHAIAETAGDDVFFAVQIYGRTAHDPESFRQWWARAQGAFPGRTMLAIAGWASSPALSTPAGFRAYLAALPEAPAAAVWPAGAIPAYMREALASYSPERPYEAGEGGEDGSPPAPAGGAAPARRSGGASVGALLAIFGTVALGAAAAVWWR